MTLLKGDDPRPSGKPPAINKPQLSTLTSKAKKPAMGLTIADGWQFGIGFGLAMLIAMPLIMAVVGCVLSMVFASGLGALAGLGSQ